jgi:demethylmenaquinone methyltransferase / 2-methoxy-6-polyprenyl-1,4-benzoquinol methylase
MTDSRIDPHPVLPAYYDSHAQRTSFVRRLFDDTAPYYDRIDEIFSFGSGPWYRRQCLIKAGLKPGQRVADIAIGTGLVAREAVRVVGDGGEVIGLDLSAGMLAVARSKLHIPLIQGSADRLPLKDGTVDFVTMGYAVRHVSDLLATFGEFQRVLRPGGTVLLLEIAKPTKVLTRAVVAGYLGGVVPLLSRWITGEANTRTLMQYYWDTIEQCVAPEVILEAMSAAGLADVRCATEFDLFRSYSGRKLPAAPH